MSYFDQDLTLSHELRKHRLGQIKSMTKSWRDTDFSKLDRGTFDILEARVLDEARATASRSGRLFASNYRDDVGRKITEFEGDPMACWAPFMRAGQRIRINKECGSHVETIRVKNGQHAGAIDNA